MYLIVKGRFLFIALLAAVSLAGCSNRLPLPDAPLAAASLLDYPAMQPSQVSPTATDDWLQLDAELRELIGDHRGRKLSIQQFRNLLFRLHDPARGGMRYRPAATLTPVQAFRQRRANCLSYSALVVVLARQVGLRAYFQRAYLAPQWSLRGNTSIAGLHINAKVFDHNGQNMQVDWGWQATGRVERVRRIDDAEALAEFHNNLGTEALLDGDYAAGYADLRYALQLAPHISHIWVNLGALFRRLGDAPAAETAWLEALRIDPDNVYAMNGLLNSYRDRGEHTLADRLQTELIPFYERNPNYHFMRARAAARRGDTNAAIDALQKAAALNPDPMFDAMINDLRESQAPVSHAEDDVVRSAL